MPARRLSVIHSGTMHPEHNMALDEALLASDREPTLRLYGWQPAGLSIGYFQSHDRFTSVPGDHVCVRRTTGGGAIYHEHELTFALIANADVVPHDLDESYATIHAAITATLGDFGVPVHRFGRGATAPRPNHDWCFTQPTCHDLMTDRGKIVGSAQRRVRTPIPRVLHHGSIVLCAPAATPGCGAVDEFVDPASIERELGPALAERIAASLDLRACEGSVQDLDTTATLAAVQSRWDRR